MKASFSPLIIALLLVGSGCAKSGQVQRQLEETQKGQAELRARNAELTRQIEELSHTMMLVEDRLGNLALRKVKSKRKPLVKWHRPDPKEKVAKKSHAKVPKESLFPVNPGEKDLPAITLTNHDLETLDRKTAAPTPGSLLVSKTSKNTKRVQDIPDASNQYNRAFDRFEKGEYVKAIADLRDFVKRFGKHRYADNALYWIGESFYQKKAYLKALAEFDRLIVNYPTGNKVPDALLRAGACHLRLSNRKGARKSFQDLIQKYPRSVAAQKAQELLADLRESHQKRRM